MDNNLFEVKQNECIELLKSILAELEDQKKQLNRLEGKTVNFYSLGEVSKMLGCGIEKARQVTRKKGFPAVKIAGKIRIPQEDFKLWLDQNRGKSI